MGHIISRKAIDRLNHVVEVQHALHSHLHTVSWSTADFKKVNSISMCADVKAAKQNLVVFFVNIMFLLRKCTTSKHSTVNGNCIRNSNVASRSCIIQ